MRPLLPMLLAAMAGVHCAAPTEPPGVGVDEVSGDAPPGSGGAAKATSEGDEPECGWAIEAEGSPPTLITTTARGDDDALYAAGTFHGALTLGDETLHARGGDDVFLVRFDADGTVAWSRAVGSVRTERTPRVTFIDGEVKLIARTDGEVDCGSGGMAKWSSEMFFYCVFDTDGSPLGGGAFPTGAP